MKINLADIILTVIDGIDAHFKIAAGIYVGLFFGVLFSIVVQSGLIFLLAGLGTTATTAAFWYLGKHK